MKNLLPFLLPALCLMLAFRGSLRLFAPWWRFKAIKISQLRKAGQRAEATELAKRKARTLLSPSDASQLKRIRVGGFVWLVAGLAGTWASGFSIGWSGGAISQWSDGKAPALEPLIENRCMAFLRKGRGVGLTVAAVSGTNATVMAFGRMAITSSERVQADTLFEIGSITKTFTGIAFAREIEQGAVRLEQPIQELLPADVELPEAARQITLRHLTTHTSGFPRLPSNLSVLGMFKMGLSGSDPYAGYGESEFKEGLRNVELWSDPGTKATYSNFAVGLLGYLLSRNAGSSYEAFIKRKVCQPLEMNDTTIHLDDEQAARFIQGYLTVRRLGPLLIGRRSAPWLLSNPLAGAGGLRSTATDMIKYLKANMRPEGHPLENAIRESHGELFRDNERTAFGMNWLRSQNEQLAKTVIWHNGGTGGFRSFLGFTEDGRAGVVVLSNTAQSVDELGGELLRELAERADTSETREPNP